MIVMLHRNTTALTPPPPPPPPPRARAMLRSPSPFSHITDIRCLIRDIGEALGSIATTHTLHRNRQGDHTEESCLTIDELADWYDRNRDALAETPPKLTT